MAPSYPESFQGFAVTDTKKWNQPTLTSYKPKPFQDNDIDIEIECCGVCGTDVHVAMGNWGPIQYPQVVGHEIIGKVIKVGPNVSTCKIGQRVGVGAQAFACLDYDNCVRCKEGNEQYCHKTVSTYAAPYKDGYISQGGYASHVRVHEHFAFPLPDEISSEQAAPLMCGGLTVYSPLVRNGCKPGATVGIIGIGGLGHMAIMIAKALGAHVVAFSRSDSKKAQSLQMGADEFIATKNTGWENDFPDKFDIILNCASQLSDLNLSAFLSTLKVEKKFVSVGLPQIDEKYDVNPHTFFKNGSYLSSACLGSREECIKLLDLAVKHNIRPWVEEVPLTQEGIGKALQRCWDGDVRYRFCLTKFHEAFGTGK